MTPRVELHLLPHMPVKEARDPSFRHLRKRVQRTAGPGIDRADGRYFCLGCVAGVDELHQISRWNIQALERPRTGVSRSDTVTDLGNESLQLGGPGVVNFRFGHSSCSSSQSPLNAGRPVA